MENKARGTKGCPTRLQKHAPASLEINKVLNNRFPNPFSPSGESSKAIPLLSPLILSPQTLYTESSIQASQNCGNEGRNSSPNTSTTGWKHPAMAPFSEPSSLCSLLQTQCVLVNNAQ